MSRIVGCAIVTMILFACLGPNESANEASARLGLSTGVFRIRPLPLPTLAPSHSVHRGARAGAPFIAFPTTPGWQFFGPQHGAPTRAYGVSADASGNVWVAGGDEGLFLLPIGASQLQRFTYLDGLNSYVDSSGVHGNRVLSVAGGPPGVVFVGYKGLFGGMEDAEPPYMLGSGDADRVEWSGAGLSISHFDISTPPGVNPHYPQGRDKIRDVLRIVYDSAHGDVWFGGNHAIGLWNGAYQQIEEHQHADINGYTASGAYTQLSGDHWGVALDAAGNLWLGGAHRLARLKFASAGRQFWAALEPVVDVWPDAFPVDPHPNERIEDDIQDLAVMPDGTLMVGSISNGLAHVTPLGVVPFGAGLASPKVTALETDSLDGSLWVGHMVLGITRLSSGGILYYGWQALGVPLANGEVLDIQSDNHLGQRRILVAFGAGAIGIYTGN